jgi:hypothetical protein
VGKKWVYIAARLTDGGREELEGVGRTRVVGDNVLALWVKNS